METGTVFVWYLVSQMISHKVVKVQAADVVHANVKESFLSGGCRWTGADGIEYDISSLGNQDGSPRFLDVKGNDDFFYSFNPCYPFNEGTCSAASVCQKSRDGKTYYQAGNTNTGKIITDARSNRLAVYYEAVTDITRKSYIDLICDPSATTPIFKAIGDVSFAEYHMELTSLCACPHGCTGSNSKADVSLSVGTILLIVFLSSAVLYVLGGIVFNRVYRQATGKDMLPNSNFWQSMPGLIKDGFALTCSRVRNVRGQYATMK